MFFPKDLSEHGHLIDGLFYLTFGLTSVAFVIVLAILAYCLIRFNQRPGLRAAFMRGESRGALLLTLALSLLVFFAIDVNLAIHDHHAYKTLIAPLEDESKALRIDVVGQQFAWNIRYPGPDGVFGKTDLKKATDTETFGLDAEDPASADDVVAMNELVVPVGADVILDLRSRDVIHSFFLPSFRVKQDLVPGLTTKMRFRAKTIGEHEIACAELCGLAHYRMRGVIRVVEEAEFKAWLEEKKSGETLEEFEEEPSQPSGQ